MENLFNVLILAAIGAVAVTLGFGIYSLYRGGDYARSNSNKLMRLRIVLQALALVLLAIGAWVSSRGGG